MEEMKRALGTALSSLYGAAPLLTTAVVEGIDGAFVVHGLLGKQECEGIRDVVREICQNDTSYTDDSIKRRDSQHHTPCMVDEITLTLMANRLRPYLPATAGPDNPSTLEAPGKEISTFLRCYDYMEGDFSSPHLDRSFSEHENFRLVRFSAYSIVIYLNDDFEGGNTTFFVFDDPTNPLIRSNKGNTIVGGDIDRARKISVIPSCGDALIFPHGRQPGCHLDYLHEGGMICAGRKTILRSDIVYMAKSVKKKGKRKLRKTEGTDAKNSHTATT